MNSVTEPIRIRIRHAEHVEDSGQGSPRERFWQAIRRQERYAETSISHLEIKLTREFSGYLRDGLVERIGQAISDAERSLYGHEVEEMLHDYRHFFHERFFRSEEKWFPYQPYDPLSRLLEFRQQVFRDVPTVRVAFDRLVAASDVTFSVRIDGYSSLDISLIVSRIEKLAQAFDSDFDSFRVFLDAFIPQAFADVFGSDVADQMLFDVEVPVSLKEVFLRTPAKVVSSAAGSEAASVQAAPTTKTDAVQRAEWLWKLANGSLLIPVLLALIVLYFGFREVGALRTLQYEALKPILEHQVQLLKEDRERFALLPFAPQPARSTAVTSQVSVPTQRPPARLPDPNLPGR